jgi:hypothetical protein
MTAWDQDPWMEEEAAELARRDADMEMAEMEAAGNAVAAARKAGRCAHQGAMGYLAGSDRGLKPGQLLCNDSGKGCGRVFADEEAWYDAMNAAMRGEDEEETEMAAAKNTEPVAVVYTAPTGNRTAGRVHRATCKHIPKGANPVSPEVAGVDALLDASRATCCSVREADVQAAVTRARSAELAAEAPADYTVAAEAADGSTGVVAEVTHHEVTDVAPGPEAEVPAVPEQAAAPAGETVPVGKRTFDPAGVTEFTCQGACGQTLPVSKFPTVTGSGKRVVECRTCRNARTKAAKAAKAGAAG